MLLLFSENRQNIGLCFFIHHLYFSKSKRHLYEISRLLYCLITLFYFILKHFHDRNNITTHSILYVCPLDNLLSLIYRWSSYQCFGNMQIPVLEFYIFKHNLITNMNLGWMVNRIVIAYTNNQPDIVNIFRITMDYILPIARPLITTFDDTLVI